jgi:Spy/CpxP family protein refolding chaperone
MKREFILGLIAATALFWGAAASAEPGKGCDEAGAAMHRHMGQGHMDPAAGPEQHLAHFKDELKLTPQQEPLWQAFADKVKETAGSGMKAMHDLDATLPAPERMARMNAMMKERLAAMESSTDAFKRLYDALTPEQKKTADNHAAHMGKRGPPGPEGRPGVRRPD